MDAKSTIAAIACALLAACVLMSPVACTMHQHRLMADAIKEGADPIDVKCALEGDSGRTNAICLARALK